MTDAEKLALITVAIEDLKALRAFYMAKGDTHAADAAYAHTLSKIAKIVGLPDIF